MNKATCVALCVVAAASAVALIVAAACKKDKKPATPALVRTAQLNEQLQEVSVSPSNDDVVTQICEHYKAMSDFLLSPDPNTVMGTVTLRQLMDTNRVRPLTIDGKSAVAVSLEDILRVSRRPDRFTRKDDQISPQIYVAHHVEGDTASAVIVIKMDELHYTLYAAEDDFVAVGPQLDAVDTMGYLELVLEKILMEWGVQV
jgi:hypothetical protein